MIIQTEFGNGRIREDGYIQITTTENKGKLLHRLVYEKHNGPIPDGFQIHHQDNDKSNNNPNNLVMISKSEHHNLHHWGSGRIDAMGGIHYLSAEKNKGRTMSEVAEGLGYTQPVPIHQYLKYRNLRWNQL